ncbi:hypothetical protein [Amycolatopsis sp. NPDC051716]|uniref:hypothetical protein n=1 Tax=Amycolatopsis sp. NPDC051716 TaxID=3155804 RepID=UPI00341DB69B
MTGITDADAGYVKAQAVMLMTASAELDDHKFGELVGRVYWELISPSDPMVSSLRHALLFTTLARLAEINYTRWRESEPVAAATWLASVVEENSRLQAG